jgi:hypothetical protein
MREGLLEELKALDDLRGRVDVKGSAVFGGEGCEVDSVAMKETVAVGKGAGGGLGGSDLLSQSLEALCWKGVGRFRDDDPGDEVDDGADAGEDDQQCSDDADEAKVPAIVEGQACANSGNHTVVSRARELTGVGIVARWGWSGGRDGGTTGGAEAGGRVDFIATPNAKHKRLRELLFCHSETAAYRKEESVGLKHCVFSMIRLVQKTTMTVLLVP